MNKNMVLLISILAFVAIAYLLISKTETTDNGDTGNGSNNNGTSSLKLTISDNTISTGDNLEFTIAGFAANETVSVTVVETGGYFAATLNSSGGGAYSFQVSDSAGTYHLRVSGDSGAVAASYTVS
jgi:maltose-binding protein MalE